MIFNKKDRFPIGVSIELDAYSIKKYLDGKKDIVSQQWDSSRKTNSYRITIIPSGESSNLYFHHKNNSITQHINAFDEFDDVFIEWSIENDEFVIRANREIILFCPLDFALKVEKQGERADFKDRIDLRNPFTKKFEKEFPDNNISLIMNLKSSSSGLATYENGLARISFHAVDNAADYSKNSQHN